MESGSFTTGEAAAACGLSRSTLRRAAARGQIRAWYTPGGHLRFEAVSCLDFARSLGRADLIGRSALQPGQSRTEPDQVTAAVPVAVPVPAQVGRP